jgi:hypothetical protein
MVTAFLDDPSERIRILFCEVDEKNLLIAFSHQASKSALAFLRSRANSGLANNSHLRHKACVKLEPVVDSVTDVYCRFLGK